MKTLIGLFTLALFSITSSHAQVKKYPKFDDIHRPKNKCLQNNTDCIAPLIYIEFMAKQTDASAVAVVQNPKNFLYLAQYRTSAYYTPDALVGTNNIPSIGGGNSRLPELREDSWQQAKAGSKVINNEVYFTTTYYLGILNPAETRWPNTVIVAGVPHVFENNYISIKPSPSQKINAECTGILNNFGEMPLDKNKTYAFKVCSLVTNGCGYITKNDKNKTISFEVSSTYIDR